MVKRVAREKKKRNERSSSIMSTTKPKDYVCRDFSVFVFDIKE
ncbi:hypothetical protein VCR15J2_660014 [Vibrio coralliirubri]|nr:hypothetical protein VCR15J2_660014 [Vibrio coralliirubri]